ncbi:hypothetical protein [Hyphobacterium sp.]|uniref:hypothetical protein n=1 Tax=Hyphobacterium sp. TaxID=2004662 RepID=UPI003BA89E01
MSRLPMNAAPKRTAAAVSNSDRARAVKDLITIGELADLLDYTPEPASPVGQICECPSCGLSNGARISESGRTFKCRSCHAEGDLIDFYRAAKRVPFTRALTDLEALQSSAPGGPQSGDLFNQGDTNGHE